MSASPRLSMASRVDSSGTTLKTRRFTPGTFFQYCSNASTTSSTPGLNETNLYGPARAGGRRGVEGEEVRPRFFQAKAHAQRIDDLDGGHPLLEQRGGGALVAL